VREQAQRRPVARAAQARDEVRALLGTTEQRDLEARIAQHPGEQLLGRALVTGRVDRVEAHEALQQLGRLALEVLAHRSRLRERPR